MPCSPGKIWSWVSSETLDLKHPSPPSHHRSPIKPTLAWLVMQSFPDHSITQIRWTRHASGLSSVQSLSHVWLFGTPWTAAPQASLSIINSRSLLKLMSIELVTPSIHLALCHPLLLPPSVFASNWVFSNESVLPIRWPKYWSVSFSNSPSNEYSGLISFRIDWLDLLAD